MTSDPIAGPPAEESSRYSREQAFAKRILAAREDERRRIARELHDETSQALTSIMVGLETVRYAHANDPRNVDPQIDTLSTIARDALSGISRLIRGLRPAALEQRGLVSALRDHAANIIAIYGIDVQTEVTGDVPPTLGKSTESGLYRMVQESMTNAAKHALAGQISVTIHFREDAVRALVEDDGVGFEASEESTERGVGLRGLAERASALGGTMLVDSTPGEGTAVMIDLPIRPGAGQ